MFRERAGEAGAGVLLAEWSAAPGSDQDDPAVWVAASPHWSPGRADAALRAWGTSGFRYDYLNAWPAMPSAEGSGWLPEWPALATGLVPDVWVAAGVEAMPGAAMVSLARAGWVGSRILVSVTRASLPDAARLCADISTVWVGKSLSNDPAWLAAGVGVQPARGYGAEVAAGFERLVRSEIVAHDGGELLSGQVAGTRLLRSQAGTVRLNTAGDVDAIKAAAWAVEAARNAAPPAAVF